MNSYAPGAVVGRYHLVSVLGKGAMGEVWEAVLHGPHGFRKRVALKLLRTSHGREELVEEARLGAMLSHPNVVGTLDLGSVDGRLYVAMELVQGATLSALLADAPLVGAALLDVGVQACAGLAHIHGLRIDGRPAGLMHRDIKPSNLIVDRTGLLKIADLGIARLAGQPGVAAGTHTYMAPEQRDGDEDARADLYALGVTLLHAATGRWPLGRRTQAPRTTDELAERLALPGLLDGVEEAAAGLGAILRRCLQPAPQDRWSDAVSLGQALLALRARTDPGPSLLQLLAERQPGASVEPTLSPSGRSLASDAETRILAPGNLPREPDRLVGRQDALASLVEQVSAGPGLVTLLGLGGAGKTRLALRAARTVRQRLPGGAWFVDLSETTTLPGVCFAVAGALGQNLDAAQPVEQVGWMLRGLGRAVVVLDNLEQVIDAAADTVSRWLEQAEDVTFLTTSRVAMRLEAERLFPVGPLEEAAASKLFEERSPRSLDADDRSALPELLLSLEGLPLAIELAAARTRVLTVEQVAGRMGQQLQLLAGGSRDRPRRQQSLRASLDGSWDLLQAWERAALAQLSVFEGGFTLGAADAVVRLDDGPEAPWTLDVLDALANASLLRFDPDRGRFRMLAVVQAYATERLDAEVREAAHRRHAAFFAQEGTAEARAARRRHGGTQRRRRLDAELENLVAACRRASELGEGEHTTMTALAAFDGLMRRGPVSLADEVLRLALAVERSPATLLAAAEVAQRMRRADEARGLAQEARNAGGARPQEQARAELLLAVFEHDDGRDAGPRLEAALALVGQAPDPALEDHAAEGHLLGNLADVLMACGESDVALRTYEEALRSLERVGDLQTFGSHLGNLGNLHLREMRLQEARRCYERALDVLARGGFSRKSAVHLGNLGIVHRFEGQLLEAESCYQKAVDAHRAAEKLRSETISLRNLGAVHLDLGRLDVARAELEVSGRMTSDFGSSLLCAIGSMERTRLAMASGDVAEGRRWVDDLFHHVDELGDHHVAQGLGLQAHILAAELTWLGGDPAGCVAALEALDCDGFEQPARTLHLLAAGAAVAAGDLERAERFLQGVRAEASQLLWEDDVVLRCVEAEITAARGDRDALERLRAELDAEQVARGAGPDAPLSRRIHRAVTQATSSTTIR